MQRVQTVSLARAATSIIFVAKKLQTPVMLAATKVLSWQKWYLWHLAGAANDKTERFAFGQDGTLSGLSAYPPVIAYVNCEQKRADLSFAVRCMVLWERLKLCQCLIRQMIARPCRCLIFNRESSLKLTSRTTRKAAWNFPMGRRRKRRETLDWRRWN